MQAVMKALMERLQYTDGGNEAFRNIIESVTEKGVFQSFVRDVVEKEGN